MEPVKTQFLLHKFNAQATDFGYTRAFEHETIMAQRNIFIDPQGERSQWSVLRGSTCTLLIKNRE